MTAESFRHDPRAVEKVIVEALRCPSQFPVSNWEVDRVSFSEERLQGASNELIVLAICIGILSLIVNYVLCVVILGLALIAIIQQRDPHYIYSEVRAENAWWIDAAGQVEKVTTFRSNAEHKLPYHLIAFDKWNRIKIPYTEYEFIFTEEPTPQSVQAMVDALAILMSVNRWERRKMLAKREGVRVGDQRGYPSLDVEGLEIQTCSNSN